MNKPNLYRPPPTPPAQRKASVDPLVALSVSPTVLSQPAKPTPAAIAPEDLSDLVDDDLEMWASGGTRILAKPASTPPVSPTINSPTIHSTVYQSFYPVSLSAPVVAPKESHAAIWVALASMFVLALGVSAAVAGFFLYRAHEREQERIAAATTTVTTAPTEVEAPIPTVTAPPISTASATPSTTHVTQSTKPAPVRAAPTTTSSTPTMGALRTFAVASGQPVFVDGHQVGVGGPGKLTTTCGRHTITVGAGKAKLVDVPCSGAPITVGSPDGT